MKKNIFFILFTVLVFNVGLSIKAGRTEEERNRYDQNRAEFLEQEAAETELRAADEASLRFIKQFIAINGIDAADSEGKTILHHAVEAEQFEAAKYLLAHGANIKAIDNKGWQPIHYASKAGLLKTMKLFVAKGASVNAIAEVVFDLSGRTMECTGLTPLMLAARKGHLDVVSYLKEQGADLNAALNFKYTGDHGDLCAFGGFTALHYAADNGQLEVVKYLFPLVANVNIVATPFGMTSLHNEEESNDDEKFDESLKVDMVMDIYSGRTMATAFFGTPFHMAVRESHLEVVKFLVEHGANVNEVFRTGFYEATILHIAARQSHLGVVKFLVEHGADVNAVIKVGSYEITTLHIAALHSSLEVVEFLVKRGVDVNAVIEGLGVTVLHNAVSSSDLKIVKFLVEHGADLTKKTTREAETALDIAREEGYQDIVDFLRTR